MACLKCVCCVCKHILCKSTFWISWKSIKQNSRHINKCALLIITLHSSGSSGCNSFFFPPRWIYWLSHSSPTEPVEIFRMQVRNCRRSELVSSASLHLVQFNLIKASQWFSPSFACMHANGWLSAQLLYFVYVFLSVFISFAKKWII